MRISQNKILNLFILYLIITLPLLGSSIINLDFSGLESLSKMGKKMTKATQYRTKKTEKIVILFKTDKEVLEFHSKYVENNQDVKKVVDLIPKNIKPKIYIEENNSYEIIYNTSNEKLTFYYVLSPKEATFYSSSVMIFLSQNDLPVWSQKTTFRLKDTKPLMKEINFYEGTRQTIDYTYSDNNQVSKYEQFSYDDTFDIQPAVLLSNEEDKRLLNTSYPLISYIQNHILKLTEKYRNSKFEATISSQKYTLKEAEEHCDYLSIEGYNVWHLPREKELLSLSTNTALKLPNNNQVFIKKEYLHALPHVKNSKELTFWTSNLEVVGDYELGKIVSFAYSLDELQNAPLDLASDKKTKHYVICQKAQNPINIRWKNGNYISIFGNNFKTSPSLKLIGSFDDDDKESKIVDYKNGEVSFPLKKFLIVNQNNKILYILDLEKKEKIGSIKLKKNEKISLKQIKKSISPVSSTPIMEFKTNSLF